MSYSDVVGIMSSLCAELEDHEIQGTQDLIACGPAVVLVLTRACQYLRSQITRPTTHLSDKQRDDAESYQDKPENLVGRNGGDGRGADGGREGSGGGGGGSGSGGRGQGAEERETNYLGITTLHTLAREMINSIPFNIVPPHWLRLYTDSALLLGLYEGLIPFSAPYSSSNSGSGRYSTPSSRSPRCGRNGSVRVTKGEMAGEEGAEGAQERSGKVASDHHQKLAAIRQLDMAIIVAGALGRNRQRWVQDTIAFLQSQITKPSYLAGASEGDEAAAVGRAEDVGETNYASCSRPRKKARISRDDPLESSASSPSRAQFSPLYAPKEIQVLSTPPTMDAYLEKHTDRPFILRNYLGGRRSSERRNDHNHDIDLSEYHHDFDNSLNDHTRDNGHYDEDESDDNDADDDDDDDDNNNNSLRWPAIERWKSAEYLLRLSGPGRVVPVEVGLSYDDAGWGQQIVPFAEFLRRSGYDITPKHDDDDDDDTDNLSHGHETKQSGKRKFMDDGKEIHAAEEVENGHGDRSGSPIRGEGGENKKKNGDEDGEGDDYQLAPLYLAQYALLDQFPELNKDISYPDYVWSEPRPPLTYPSYQPPVTDTGVSVNVWIGSSQARIVSPAHTDPYYNCYAQVVGKKRVWLAPPNDGKDMYAYGNDNSATATGTSDRRDSGGGDEAPAPARVEEENSSDLASQYMTNTSQVPILRPIDNFLKLRSRYPRFFENVWPGSMEAVLGPGDLLVFPPGWWHAMRGEGSGPGWSVSMWY